MLKLFEYSKFNLVNDISSRLSSILPHVRVIGNTLYASTDVDKSKLPITRIDSKKPIAGILLKFNEDSIEIKSIINSTSTKGIGSKILKVVLSSLEPGYSIIVNQDVSGGYWDSIIKEYPKYKWSFV